ncbi:hypothetical protein [Parachitinimonas caeni]|uniref:Transposase n=1 Tax=Parachitinimonas caeni TaxID=3031301 RepID=A0ABT7DT60_9NEIS|nr:hypothetical protein [Parachitinimonas caeni]MDK2123258.1 hypothetical protein [Parachitinimonas caeni]
MLTIMLYLFKEYGLVCDTSADWQNRDKQPEFRLLVQNITKILAAKALQAVPKVTKIDSGFTKYPLVKPEVGRKRL